MQLTLKKQTLVLHIVQNAYEFLVMLLILNYSLWMQDKSIDKINVCLFERENKIK